MGQGYVNIVGRSKHKFETIRQSLAVIGETLVNNNIGTKAEVGSNDEFEAFKSAFLASKQKF